MEQVNLQQLSPVELSDGHLQKAQHEAVQAELPRSDRAELPKQASRQEGRDAEGQKGQKGGTQVPLRRQHPKARHR